MIRVNGSRLRPVAPADLLLGRFRFEVELSEHRSPELGVLAANETLPSIGTPGSRPQLEIGRSDPVPQACLSHQHGTLPARSSLWPNPMPRVSTRSAPPESTT